MGRTSPLLKAKAVSASRVVKTEVVQPGNSNTRGTLFGGQLMAWVDTAAAVCAHRHCRRPVVTASMDEIFFFSPIHVGDIVILEAHVNYTGHTSMEVEVDVQSENPDTGEKTHTNMAYLTFVAVDKTNRPMPVPPLLLQTQEERRRFKEAEARRRARLARMAERRSRIS